MPVDADDDGVGKEDAKKAPKEEPEETVYEMVSTDTVNDVLAGKYRIFSNID